LVGALVFALVAALYLSLMQFTPSEHPYPLPFIFVAKAFEVMIGAGIKSAKVAITIAAVVATAGKINFMIRFLFGLQSD
jgi:hypothetical protein